MKNIHETVHKVKFYKDNAIGNVEMSWEEGVGESLAKLHLPNEPSCTSFLYTPIIYMYLMSIYI